MSQALAQRAVYRLLHRLVGASIFLGKKSRYVLIQSESCAHIMMLAPEAS